MRDKFAIADALREIALLLELKRENPYKARAYNIGAAAVESISEDLGHVIEEDRLKQVRGIGDTLAAKIEEIYRTGQSKMLERLRSEMPPGVIELSQIHGLSINKIQVLHSQLGVASIEELEAACRAGQVRTVRGFGEKTEANILSAIERYKTREKSELLCDALELSNRLKRHLEHTPGVKRVEIAGAVRRWKEVVKNIKLIAVCAKPDAAFEKLAQFPLVTHADTPIENRMTVRLSNGLHVDLLCVPEIQFPSAWLVDTGSDEHVHRLQKLARTHGYELDGSGLRQASAYLNVKTESDVYQHLGLPFLPPEVREGWGEVDAALNGQSFEDLVRIEDIQGMVHCHTYFSDGKNSVEEMARAAQNLGMQYITITDHSPAAHYAGGLDFERLKEQWEEIDRAQEKLQIKILRGTESDILADGALDYPDWLLDRLDIIIASVHSRLKMDEDEMTKRIVRCMRLPQFKIWGHPLGRLILRREPLSVRMPQVLDTIAQSNAAIEVNGDPYRLDMQPEYIREARKRGIKFVISVDAHSTGALNYLRFGVHQARRGALRKSEVLNTLNAERFTQAVHP